MDSTLESLRTELEQFGKTNDAAHSDYPQRMLNITRVPGNSYLGLVRAMSARRVLGSARPTGNRLSGSRRPPKTSEARLRL